MYGPFSCAETPSWRLGVWECVCGFPRLSFLPFWLAANDRVRVERPAFLSSRKKIATHRLDVEKNGDWDRIGLFCLFVCFLQKMVLAGCSQSRMKRGNSVWSKEWQAGRRPMGWVGGGRRPIRRRGLDRRDERQPKGARGSREPQGVGAGGGRGRGGGRGEWKELTEADERRQGDTVEPAQRSKITSCRDCQTFVTPKCMFIALCEGQPIALQVSSSYSLLLLQTLSSLFLGLPFFTRIHQALGASLCFVCRLPQKTRRRHVYVVLFLSFLFTTRFFFLPNGLFWGSADVRLSLHFT